MEFQFRKIGAGDTGWHEAFHRYIQRIFPRVSFRKWCEYGGWDDGYTAHALTSGREIVANASLQRMRLVVEGRDVTGWQLGAVGTLPELRDRGLQRTIMAEALRTPAATDKVFLFANPKVTGFYPRFGFRRVPMAGFGVARQIVPATEQWQRLTADDAEHRRLLARIAESSRPVTSVFGARNYGNIALWYWTNFNRDHFFYSRAHDAIVVAEQEGELLRVLDVMAAESVDLASCLPSLIDSPVSRIEFWFTPELIWPASTPIPARDDDDSPFFVRVDDPLPDQPFSFPALAHT